MIVDNANTNVNEISELTVNAITYDNSNMA